MPGARQHPLVPPPAHRNLRAVLSADRPRDASLPGASMFAF